MTRAEALGLHFHAEPRLGQAPSPPPAAQAGAALAPAPVPPALLPAHRGARSKSSVLSVPMAPPQPAGHPQLSHLEAPGAL